MNLERWARARSYRREGAEVEKERLLRSYLLQGPRWKKWAHGLKWVTMEVEGVGGFRQYFEGRTGMNC